MSTSFAGYLIFLSKQIDMNSMIYIYIYMWKDWLIDKENDNKSTVGYMWKDKLTDWYEKTH